MNHEDRAKELIENAARLEAIETLLAHVLCTMYYNAPLMPEDLLEPHARLVERFAQRAYEGVSPVLSDHYADEVKFRIEHILGLSVHQLAALRQK